LNALSVVPNVTDIDTASGHHLLHLADPLGEQNWSLASSKATASSEYERVSILLEPESRSIGLTKLVFGKFSQSKFFNVPGQHGFYVPH